MSIFSSLKEMVRSFFVIDNTAEELTDLAQQVTLISASFLPPGLEVKDNKIDAVFRYECVNVTGPFEFSVTYSLDSLPIDPPPNPPLDIKLSITNERIVKDVNSGTVDLQPIFENVQGGGKHNFKISIIIEIVGGVGRIPFTESVKYS